jgi:signal transduction histidine kinase
MPDASPASAAQALQAASLERATMVRHGIATTAACLLIAAAFSLARHGRWDVNLVYSLSIGLISWLTIETGRWRMSRGQSIPWPGGWRGVALVVAGIVTGFVLGSLIGNVYRQWAEPEASSSLMHRLWIPLAVTTIACAVMSLAFFLLGYSRHLQMQAEQARRQAAEAQLGLLQAQLEPHMLFNTLANLRVLVGTDPQRAQAMLDHLIAYLRATLGGSRSTEHALREEFARLRDYLALMSIRMGPRLRYTLDLPEELADLPIPPLLLQPLVENCIRHGLEPKLEGGHIEVRVRHGTDSRIVLSVADDGMGLDAAAPATPGSHFGTAQLRERLASRYGEGAHFALSARPEGGTLARITLPGPRTTPG